MNERERLDWLANFKVSLTEMIWTNGEDWWRILFLL